MTQAQMRAAMRRHGFAAEEIERVFIENGKLEVQACCEEHARDLLKKMADHGLVTETQENDDDKSCG